MRNKLNNVDKDKDHKAHDKSNRIDLTKKTFLHNSGNIMDGVDIEDLTMEQYLELTQNHAPSVVDIFDINGIADLEASVNIMSESILEELSLVDPKNTNIIVSMADQKQGVYFPGDNRKRPGKD
ncbi:hypothetical protein Tco_0875534 [Tanacetum coccineum]|uniref:Uncharacterized protein n=1 Tax=Tanacetum coccineum TaxID=301880 RepID=A0ABQ5BSP4_9ASTR